MRHNERWDTEDSRCPMWLNSIHDIDASWPSDADEAVLAFSRKKVLRKLKLWLSKWGEPMYDRLSDIYGEVRGCGFTKSEIQACDATGPLFRRA